MTQHPPTTPPPSKPPEPDTAPASQLLEPPCGATYTIHGTTANITSQADCDLPAGHPGGHHGSRNGSTWTDPAAGPDPLARARELEADIHRRLRTLAHATQPPVEHVLEACHGGLDPSQTIRAVAVLTVGWPESELRCGGFWESLTTCEAYIRDGTRPEPQPQPEQPVCTCTPVPGRPNVRDGNGCARHNPALREESRP